MTVYAITDTKKGEQGLRLLIFKLPLQLLKLSNIGLKPTCLVLWIITHDQTSHLAIAWGPKKTRSSAQRHNCGVSLKHDRSHGTEK